MVKKTWKVLYWKYLAQRVLRVVRVCIHSLLFGCENLHKTKYNSLKSYQHILSKIDCSLILDCHIRIIFWTSRLNINARKCEYIKNVPYPWNEAGHQLHRFIYFISISLSNIMFWWVCTLLRKKLSLYFLPALSVLRSIRHFQPIKADYRRLQGFYLMGLKVCLANITKHCKGISDLAFLSL